MRTIKQVQYVPNLAHNLLTVGQLLGSSCTVLFTNGECIIKDEESSSFVVRIEMSKHKLFPLSINEIGNAHVGVSKLGDSLMWHRRHGHLHSQAL